MKRRFCYLVFFLLFLKAFINDIYAQKAQLKVAINSERLQKGDTLDLVATYTLGDKKLPPATFAVVLKENNGKGIWQMRWPMINGHAEASLFFPPSFPKGIYTFYFAVQPRFFRLYGEVLYPPNIKSLDGTIYIEDASQTVKMRIEKGSAEIPDLSFEKTFVISRTFKMPVDKGSFKIPDLLFENTAVFEIQPSGKYLPAITLDAWLDSSFLPAASVMKEIAFGLDSSVDIFQPDNGPEAREKALSYFDPFYAIKSLQNMTDAQKFDSVYVSAPFKKEVLQQFDCLNDSALVKSKSLEGFLNKHYPGFKMNEAYGEYVVPTAVSGSYNFIFYLNEHPTSFSVLNNLKLSDIAMIKILSPSASIKQPQNKSRYIIALFTKKGPFCKPDVYRHSYIINGYQPSIYGIPSHSKFFATDPYYFF